MPKNTISKKLVSKLSYEQLQAFNFRSTVYSKHYTYSNYTLVRVTKSTVL